MARPIAARPIAAVTIYADDPWRVAPSYARGLGLRLEHAAEGDGVALLFWRGAAPWLALTSRHDRHGRSRQPDGVPASAGVRRLACGDGQDVTPTTALVSALGLAIDTVPPAWCERDQGAALALWLAGEGARPVAIPSADAPAALGGECLDHMALDVVEPALALAAVKEHLGFGVLEELAIAHPSGPARVVVTAGSADGFQLVLGDTEVGDAHPITRQIHERGGPGVHHVAHRVRDLGPALDAALRGGVEQVGKVQDAPGLRQVFVTAGDDGTVHEIVHRTGVNTFVGRSTAALMEAGGQHSEGQHSGSKHD